jgi:hypothetical protein
MSQRLEPANGKQLLTLLKKCQENHGEIFEQDQNQQTRTQGSWFDSSIGSSAEDLNP